MRDVPDIVAKAGDTQPIVQTLTASGVPVDITDASVRLVLAPVAGGAGVSFPCSIVDPAAGTVGVDLSTADPGDYAGEYEVTDAGLVKSYPDGGHVWVRVWADLD